MNAIIKMLLAVGRAPAVKRYGRELVAKAMQFMKQNPDKVKKLKAGVTQEPASKLPLFEKLGKNYVSKGYKYDYLKPGGYSFGHLKGTDITKGMMRKIKKQ